MSVFAAVTYGFLHFDRTSSWQWARGSGALTFQLRANQDFQALKVTSRYIFTFRRSRVSSCHMTLAFPPYGYKVKTGQVPWISASYLPYLPALSPQIN